MQAIAGICGPAVGTDRHCEKMLACLTVSTPRLCMQEFGQGSGVAIFGSATYGQPAQALADPRPAPVPAGNCLLLADSRLDNRTELSGQLDLSPGSTDEQLLIAAWQQWGPAMADHLLGGFALACWDARQKTLFLARDHAGERPLHFARRLTNNGAFAFASMPLALCALPWIGRSIDIRRMAFLLSLAEAQTSQTFFRGVEGLRPGHWLKLTPEGMEIRRYWHPSDARPIRYRRDQDYVEDLRERLDRAVGDRLESSTGIASELSGGLDSSSVTVTAARLLAGLGQRVTAFTGVPVAGYDGRALPGRFGDEGNIAAAAAALYPNIDHVRLDAAGRDLVQASLRYSRLTGEPTLNPTNQLWLDAILDGVHSRGLRVLLQAGDGNATISYGGLAGLGDLFRRGRWFTLLRQTRQLRAGGDISWRAAAAWATGPIIPLRLRRLFQPEMKAFSFNFSPVHPDRAAEYGLQERVFEAFYGSDASSESARHQMYESVDPGVTNAAAAAGWQVELRDPTHDKRIYEFCFGIPAEQYLVGGQARSLIRRAMQGRLPESTLRRTDRGLQAADWYLVMGGQREQIAAELWRTERSPLVRHLIDTPRLRALLDNWPQTGHDKPEVNSQWHLALSRGISAASFLAEHDPDMPSENV